MATAAASTHFPRIRFRPRLSFGAVLGGLALGLGVTILLQQFSVTYPSLAVVLGCAIGGIVVSLLSGNIGRLLATRRFNAQLVAIERGGGVRSEAVAPRVEVGGGWRATHVVASDGTPAWGTADNSGPPDVMLQQGVQLELVDEENGLVEVRAHTGWSGWVPLERLTDYRG